MPPKAKKTEEAKIPDIGTMIRRAMAEKAKPKHHPTFGMFTQESADRNELFRIHREAFRCGGTKHLGGLTRAEHFIAFCKINWPGIDSNPWLERQMKSLWREDVGNPRLGRVRRFESWVGCGSAGKTFGAGLAACGWWSADPYHSIVVLTSTTKEQIRRRVWPVIQNLQHEYGDAIAGRRIDFGYMQESRTMVQVEKGDDKHAIYAMAVAHGETATAVANLKGVHAKRIMLIIDEAEGTPPAICETIPNMQKGCEEFVVIMICNPVSHMDIAGRSSEPAAGWESITVDSEEWVTKGVPEWQLPSGICVHFDGAKSPNVVLRENKFPYLYSYDDWISAQASKGERSSSFWSQDRGFWAPAGCQDTVMNEPMVIQYGGLQDEIKFRSYNRPVAFLDPAFGGDDCILQFGVIGDDDTGKPIVMLTEFIEIPVDATDEHEKDFQIAHRAIDECKARRVEPNCFGTDSTGTGRGVASIIAAEWSPGIIRVEFGGAASDKPAAEDDPRPSHEVYDRRVTELWFSCQRFLKAGQLKGLYHDAVIQFCHRQFVHRSRKIVLDTKKDCKEKIGRSPDHADAISGLIEVVRELGIVPEGPGNLPANVEWERFTDQNHDIYDPQWSYLEPYES